MKRRRQVKSACINCRKKHAGCDNSRPCQRCVRNGTTESCCDAPRKRRKVINSNKCTKNKQKGTKNEVPTSPYDTDTMREILTSSLARSYSGSEYDSLTESDLSIRSVISPVDIGTSQSPIEDQPVYGTANIGSEIQPNVIIQSIDEEPPSEMVTLNIGALYEEQNPKSLEEVESEFLDSNRSCSESLEPTTPPEDIQQWDPTYSYIESSLAEQNYIENSYIERRERGGRQDVSPYSGSNYYRGGYYTPMVGSEMIPDTDFYPLVQNHYGYNCNYLCDDMFQPSVYDVNMFQSM